MKYEWEPKDLTPGRVIRYSKTKANNNKAMICSKVDGSVLLVALADGFVFVAPKTKEDMAHWLNGADYEPTDDDRATVQAIDYLRGER